MFLNALGSLFVYRSPAPRDGLRSHLLMMSNKKLRGLLGTTSHYSKKNLVNRILKEMNNNAS